MHRKYRVKNAKLILNFLLVGCIVLSTGLLSIGYAAITSTDLNLNLSVSTSKYAHLFIDNVEYVSNNGADLTSSKIIDYTNTMLHSDVFLSKTDGTSTITYKITMLNNSDGTRKFVGVNYLEENYSNNAIGYRLDGLKEGDLIEVGKEKTFNITFYYINTSDLDKNELNSFLNFEFNYDFTEETDVDISVSGDESYEFAGISPSTPQDVKNIGNIHFNIKNGNEGNITGIKVVLIYTTSTGSTQSATVGLYRSNGALIGTPTEVVFGKKQTDAEAIATFNSSIQPNEVVEVRFETGNVTNNQVKITGIKITPLF